MTQIPITEDRIGKLREFGLSEYAARAYLALLDLGTAEARAISTLSKVPTSKIYHVLEQLHERGLVDILPEFPKRYAPVPFEAFLEKVLHTHQRAVTSLEEDWGGLVDMFSLKGDVELERRGSFAIVRGRRNILMELSTMVAGSEREVILSGTEGNGNRAKLLQSEIRQANGRGVRFRMVCPVTLANLPALQALGDHLDTRHRETPDSRVPTGVCIAVVDATRAIIAHFIPDDDTSTRGDDTAITTDDPGMVLALRALLDDSWTHAEPLEARRAALTGEPVAAPGPVPSPAPAAAPVPAAPAPAALTAPVEGPVALEAFLAGAREHVILSAPAADLEAWSATPAWRAALARGVRIRVLTDAPAAAVSAVEARRAPRVALRAAVADGREALFTVPSRGDAAGSEPWFRSTDVLHLATLSGAFETAWQAAEGGSPRAEAAAGVTR